MNNATVNVTNTFKGTFLDKNEIYTTEISYSLLETYIILYIKIFS